MINNVGLLTLLPHSANKIETWIRLAIDLKKSNSKPLKSVLKGKHFVLIFEKQATRTRCAFEVAIRSLGGDVTYIGPGESHLGKKESVKDSARVLGQMFDGIIYRGYGQEIVNDFALYSGVPVWNALTSEFHPTQALADFMTIVEYTAKPLNEVVLSYVGDARNNVANSLMIMAAKMGVTYRAVAPSPLFPEEQLVLNCKNICESSGGSIEITSDMKRGVSDADFIYTDVWVSMGEGTDVWKERLELLYPFQVNTQMMKMAAPDCRFMHCLPAFHNSDTAFMKEKASLFGLNEMEVTNDVFESSASIVFDQAANKLHTIKAMLFDQFENLH